MNETVETILARRTAHFYLSDPVDDTIVDTALRCALRAPNHKLTNPWRFVRVGPKTRSELVDITVTIKRENGPISDAQVEKVRAKVGSSPELFVVVQVLDDDEFRRREDYAACACAIQNFSLALWSHGVASKWSTGGATRDRRAYELLQIDPESEEVVGFVFVGYPEGELPQTPRLGVASVLRVTE